MRQHFVDGIAVLTVILMTCFMVPAVLLAAAADKMVRQGSMADRMVQWLQGLIDRFD